MKLNEKNIENDPRIGFIYQEALRGLTQQQTLVENMSARAGAVIFATAFVSSLLGGQALTDGLGFWDWFAVLLLFGIGVLIVIMLWPYYKFKFRFDPEELLSLYIDNDKETSMTEMLRALSIRIEKDRKDNWQIIQRLRITLQFALILLLLEILAWLLAIAGI